jgi:GNAT superfamily N-acetyltransferase
MMNGPVERMTYRPLRRTDLESYAELFVALISSIQESTSDPYFDFDNSLSSPLLESLGDQIKQEDHKVFVAELEGSLVGFISGELKDPFVPLAPVGKIGYISGAYVRLDHRRRGILRKLESMLSQWFAEAGIQYLELNALTANSLATASWEKLCYETFRVQMRKKL